MKVKKLKKIIKNTYYFLNKKIEKNIFIKINIFKHIIKNGDKNRFITSI